MKNYEIYLDSCSNNSTLKNRICSTIDCWFHNLNNHSYRLIMNKMMLFSKYFCHLAWKLVADQNKFNWDWVESFTRLGHIFSSIILILVTSVESIERFSMMTNSFCRFLVANREPLPENSLPTHCIYMEFRPFKSGFLFSNFWILFFQKLVAIMSPRWNHPTCFSKGISCQSETNSRYWQEYSSWNGDGNWNQRVGENPRHCLEWECNEYYV